MQDKYPVIDMKETGRRLRQLIKARRLTVRDVQDSLGLTASQTVYHWFNGRSLPSIDNLYALSLLTETPLDQLVCGSRERLVRKKRAGDRVMAYVRWLKAAS